MLYEFTLFWVGALCRCRLPDSGNKVSIVGPVRIVVVLSFGAMRLAIHCASCLFVVVVTAVLGVGGVGAAEIPSIVGGVEPPTPIAAWGTGGSSGVDPDGKGVLSSWCSGSAADTVTALPDRVARVVPFYVELGTDEQRWCAGYVLALPGGAGVGQYWDGAPTLRAGAADVYKLDLGTGKEVRYLKVNASDGNGTGRKPMKVASRSPARINILQTDLYAKTIESSAPSQRLPGGSRGVNTSSPLKHRAIRNAGRIRVALPRRRHTQPYDLRVDTIGGGHVVLDHTTGDGQSLVYIGWPSFEEARRTGCDRALATPADARRGFASSSPHTPERWSRWSRSHRCIQPRWTSTTASCGR